MAPGDRTRPTRSPSPFDPGNAIADPSALVDAGLVEEMASAAADQNNFKTPAALRDCPSQKCTLNTWPAQGAIYFFDAGGNTLDFKANTSPKAKGVIVVRNGNFQFQQLLERLRGRDHRYRQRDNDGYILPEGQGRPARRLRSGER